MVAAGAFWYNRPPTTARPPRRPPTPDPFRPAKVDPKYRPDRLPMPSGPKSILVPAAIAALLVAGPACARQGRAPRLPDGVELIGDVEYGQGGGRPLRLHLLRPRAGADRPRPAVIWVHGGAWRGGSRDGGIAQLAPLVQRGYVGASIEYRLSGEATFPAQIEDCKAAVRFLRAHADRYGIDPDRIGAWGSSAGGHLVALLGTSGGVAELEGQGGWPDRSSRLQAVCNYFGPTDFLKMDAAGSRMRHDAPGSPEAQLLGAPIREVPEKVARANPITYVTADAPPFLIVHGDRDPVVPFNQSELLLAALRGAGVEATLHRVEGGGHGFGPRPELDRLVIDFFDRTLGHPPGSEPAGGADPDNPAEPR